MNNNKVSRKIWSLLPWIVFVLLLLIIFRLGSDISEKKSQLADAKKNAIQKAPIATNIVVQKLLPMRMEDKINLPAITSAWEDLIIKTEVAGKVISLKVKEGDKVDKNQIIALIDSRNYQNRFDTINARFLLAKSNYKRLEKLSKKSAVSASRYDESLAALNELEAGMADATIDLQRCTITAPFAGIINNIPAKEGELLAYADPVAQLLDITRIKLDVAIPESAVGSVRDIDDVVLTFSSLNDRQIIGKKNFLASQPSSAAMSYSLQLALSNNNLDILPGMFARANIVKAVFENAIGIPIYAVLNEDDSKFVYVIENDIAVKREISTGFIEGWLVYVKSGLSADEQIAIVGHRGLESGQNVNIVKIVTDPGEITR